MFRLIVAFTAALAVFGSAKSAVAEDGQSDPVTVIKRLFEARNSGNAEAAAALFAADGEVVNIVGRKFAGRHDINAFMAAGIAQKGRYELEEVDAQGGTVTWTDLVTNVLYEKLEIAPVRVVGQAVIHEGKIKSFVTHLPPYSLAKFEQVCEPACEVAKADGVLFAGLLCPQFLRSAKAHMRSARTP
jgi:SnoaL-like domain